jgi:hypothetical protein
MHHVCACLIGCDGPFAHPSLGTRLIGAGDGKGRPESSPSGIGALVHDGPDVLEGVTVMGARSRVWRVCGRLARLVLGKRVVAPLVPCSTMANVLGQRQ